MNHDMYFWYGVGALTTIPAIITGLMAGPPLEEFEESGDGKGSRKGLALAGTVVGCGCLLILLVGVVIAVLCLLGPAIGNVFSRISSGLY